MFEPVWRHELTDTVTHGWHVNEIPFVAGSNGTRYRPKIVWRTSNGQNSSSGANAQPRGTTRIALIFDPSVRQSRWHGASSGDDRSLAKRATVNLLSTRSVHRHFVFKRVDRALYDRVASSAKAFTQLLETNDAVRPAPQCVGIETPNWRRDLAKTIRPLRDLSFRAVYQPPGLNFVTGKMGLIPRRE